MTFPFPYIGEGRAGYFEWDETFILFSREPSAEEKKKIEAGVPAAYDEPGWKGPVVTAGAGQFVNVDIAESYGDRTGSEPELNDFLGMIATSDQCEQFDEDRIRWLKECHEIVPVLVAVHPPDYEAGGTEFGDWHRWSLTQFKESVLPHFEDDLPKTQDYRWYVLTRSISMWKEKNKLSSLPQGVQDWFETCYDLPDDD